MATQQRRSHAFDFLFLSGKTLPIQGFDTPKGRATVSYRHRGDVASGTNLTLLSGIVQIRNVCESVVGLTMRQIGVTGAKKRCHLVVDAVLARSTAAAHTGTRQFWTAFEVSWFRRKHADLFLYQATD